MATLRVLGATNYAIASGQSHVAGDTAWILLDKNYIGDYPLDSEPLMSVPTKSVLIMADGTGAPSYGGRPGGAAAPRGLWHSFTWTYPAQAGGASWQLLQDLLNSFPTGGAVTVHGLDPYGVPSPTQRSLAFCFWDCMMQEISTTALQRFYNGADLILKFAAATCRTS